tara:strand:- start:62 stop:766 length:705 start_codon:yes stop_codon:yes gene_type:complete
MKLAGFGCSMLWGWNTNGTMTKETSLAYQLGMLMEREWINKAINGSGNDLIYEKLISSHYSKEINPKDTFVLIGWSEGFRRKVFHNDKVSITFRPSATINEPNEEYWSQHSNALFSDYFMNTNQMYYDNLKSIIGTYHLLENYGYKYLMFDALTIMHDGHHNELNDYTISEEWIPQELIDVKKSIKNYFTDISYQKYLEKLFDEGKMPYISESDRHPNEYGAKVFSKKLYKKIK